MVRNNASLLSERQAGLRDQNNNKTGLLQKCILLGSQVGSERPRIVSDNELKGYEVRQQ